MYTPYLRGKQYELIALRELAGSLNEWRTVPLIEPVRTSFNRLTTAMDELARHGVRFRVVLNPKVGQLVGAESELAAFLSGSQAFRDFGIPSVILQDDSDIAQLKSLLSPWAGKEYSLIHDGFTDDKAVKQATSGIGVLESHIFIEDNQELYMNQFSDEKRILVKDGFQQMRNAAYGQEDAFSGLHELYSNQGLQGFGDFLTIGNNYSDSGGPAYAVAIHLTYLDKDLYNSMFCRHYKSQTNDTPSDPANKFLEAVTSLYNDRQQGFGKFETTSGLTEFLNLHSKSHYPGLGYVKKLSIKHHIETLGLAALAKSN